MSTEETIRVTSDPITADDATPEQIAEMSGNTPNAGTTTINVGEGTSTVSVSSPQETPPPAEFQLPEKFKTAEDLYNSYKELEKKLGEPLAGTPEPPTATPDGTLDISSYQSQWAEQGGKLSEDQWSELQTKTGLPLDVLKDYESKVIAEAQGTLTSNDNKIYDLAGGQDKYDQMIDWATGSMTQSQIDALNTQLDNPQFSEMGVNMLKNMYEQANGKEPQATTLGSAAVDGTLGPDEFVSEFDFDQAMKHPEYGKGGAYDKHFHERALRFMKRTGQI